MSVEITLGCLMFVPDSITGTLKSSKLCSEKNKEKHTEHKPPE